MDLHEEKLPAAKAKRLIDPTENIPEGSYVRVHVNPKRYIQALNVNWEERINYIDDDVVCVEKPCGIPCCAGVDNVIENLTRQVEIYLTSLFRPTHRSVPTPLQVTGRLDTCTSGLVVLARNSNSSRYIHCLAARRLIKKRYLVLCHGSSLIPPGSVRHCFRKKRIGHRNSKPTLLREYSPEFLMENPAWKLAELKILKSSKFSGSCRLHDEDETVFEEGNLYEYEVELVTGRTHQIRLQFAAMGSPIVGDTRYAPVAGHLESTLPDPTFGPDPSSIGLHCSAVDLPQSHDRVISSPPPANGVDSNSTINLRSKLMPWWRAKTIKM